MHPLSTAPLTREPRPLERPALLEELKRHSAAVVCKGVLLLAARRIVGIVAIIEALSQL